MLKFPNSRIAVSALTHREDLDLSAKLHDVNENLKSLSESNNFTFIDNSIIILLIILVSIAANFT